MELGNIIDKYTAVYCKTIDEAKYLENYICSIDPNFKDHLLEKHFVNSMRLHRDIAFYFKFADSEYGAFSPHAHRRIICGYSDIQDFNTAGWNVFPLSDFMEEKDIYIEIKFDEII